jgi:hypothetical protein
MKALHKIERTGNVTHLMTVDSTNIPNTYIIGTNSFFKMLGYTERQAYSNALAKEIDTKLRNEFEWLKLMSVESSYKPRTGTTTRRMKLRDIMSQKEYIVLFKRGAEMENDLRATA